MVLGCERDATKRFPLFRVLFLFCVTLNKPLDFECSDKAPVCVYACVSMCVCVCDDKVLLFCVRMSE